MTGLCVGNEEGHDVGLGEDFPAGVLTDGTFL